MAAFALLARMDNPIESRSCTSAHAAARRHPGARVPRALRWLLLICGALVVVTGAGLWIATRSWFIIWLVEPALEEKLGGEVTIRHAEYQGGGRVVFRDVELQVAALDGPASQVAAIGRAIILIDMHQLLTGDVDIQYVEVEDGLLRLSEDEASSGRMNFMALDPQLDADSSSRRGAPPRIRIHNAALEFGSHSGAEFNLLGRRMVAGEMYPTSGTRNWYTFELREVDSHGHGLGEEGLIIKGQWNVATNEHHSRLDGLELDERVYWMCPQMARFWWDQLALSGKVDGVVMNWHPQQQPAVEFAVRDVALTMPIDPEGLWARYRAGEVEETQSRPRMHVSNGLIRLTTNTMTMEGLTGRLASSEEGPGLATVPYAINLSIADIPPVDWDRREAWMEQVVSSAPFALTFRIDEFSLERSESGESPAIELPLIVAKSLSKFNMTNWVLSTSVTVSRKPAQADESGALVASPTVTNGQAYIHKASGSYERFPYQLDDVDAYLQFDNERVVVHYLLGTGSDGARLRISGEIAPPEKHAAVTLRLTGTNVPVDDRLRNALRNDELAAFDAVFHRPAHERLAAAGLLASDASATQARQLFEATLQEIESLRAADDSETEARSKEIAELQKRAARLGRLAAGGPFVLGGSIDLDLKIERENGQKKPTHVTGRIDIHSGGIIYEKFPYPLQVQSGSLQWERDRVAIVPGERGLGLEVVTPGGGAGSITGAIEFPEVGGKRRVQPNLRFAVSDERVNPNILAAIPLSKGEREDAKIAERWPGGSLSRAAALVRGIGLDGSLDYAGSISTHPQSNRVEYDFELNLNQGQARPTRELAGAMGATAEPWPAGFVLGDVGGSMRVTRDEIAWTDVTGRAGDSSVSATGRIDLRGDQTLTSVAVDLRNFTVERNMLNLVPADHLLAADRLWANFQPRGAIDGRILHEVQGDDSETSFSIQPRGLTILLDAHRVSLNRTAGAVAIREGSLDFEELALDIQSAGDRRGVDDEARPAPTHGTLMLDGSWNLAGSGAWQVQGRLAEGRLESPLVIEAMRILGAANYVQTYRGLDLSGMLDADFHARGGGELQAPTYTLSLQPQSIAFRTGPAPLDVEIRSGGIVIEPGHITVQRLRGQHEGDLFEIDGLIEIEGPIDASLTLDYWGRLRGDFAEAMLPAAARRVLQSIAFRDGGPTTIKDGRLHARQVARGDARHWDIDFTGQLSTRGASFVAGIPMAEVFGDFNFDLHADPDGLRSLNLNVAADQLLVAGQMLSDAEASVRLIDDARVLQLHEFRAQAGEGVVAAEARAAVEEGGEYEAHVEAVGVPLEGFMGALRGSPASRAGQRRPQGEIFANLQISGRRDMPETRRGRGVVRVLDGRMATLPLALQAVQLLQLTIPLSGSLDYADAQMYLIGDRVVFERILFESTVGKNAALQLIGEGEMNLDTFELSTRFRSRGGLAVVRDIVGGLGDRLYGIEVTGTLREPRARIVPLPDVN